jgi:branched-chain amino acid transport system permease protein
MHKEYIKYIVVLAVVIFLFFFPQIIKNPYYIRVWINTFYLIVLTVSLRMILMTGQVSIAHYAFMGIGAYTSALLVTKVHWNFWLTLPLAGIIAAVVAIPLGYITLRIKGAYFAIATVALGEVIRMVWVEWKGVFGGMNGIMGIPSPSPIDGLMFGSMPSYYYFALILMLFALAIMYQMDRSRYGMTFRSIAIADNLAESVGINIMNYKVFAFTVACFFAGLCGALYSSLQHYISPMDFTPMESMMLIVFLVVGGRANILGPIVGVCVLVWLPVFLEQLPGYKPTILPIIYGAFLLVVMLFIPDGVLGIPSRVRSAIERLGFPTGVRSAFERFRKPAEELGSSQE